MKVSKIASLPELDTELCRAKKTMQKGRFGGRFIVFENHEKRSINAVVRQMKKICTKHKKGEALTIADKAAILQICTKLKAFNKSLKSWSFKRLWNFIRGNPKEKLMKENNEKAIKALIDTLNKCALKSPKPKAKTSIAVQTQAPQKSRVSSSANPQVISAPQLAEHIPQTVLQTKRESKPEETEAPVLPTQPELEEVAFQTPLQASEKLEDSKPATLPLPEIVLEDSDIDTDVSDNAPSELTPVSDNAPSELTPVSELTVSKSELDPVAIPQPQEAPLVASVKIEPKDTSRNLFRELEEQINFMRRDVNRILYQTPDESFKEELLRFTPAYSDAIKRLEDVIKMFERLKSADQKHEMVDYEEFSADLSNAKQTVRKNRSTLDLLQKMNSLGSGM